MVSRYGEESCAGALNTLLCTECDEVGGRKKLDKDTEALGLYR